MFWCLKDKDICLIFPFLNLSTVPKLKRELDCANMLLPTIFYPTRASMTGCLWTTPTPSPSTWPKCFKREGSRCHFQILQAKVFHKSTSWQAKGTISEYFAISSTWNFDFNNFQNARILQCKWRGGANDQEVVQVSMKNLIGTISAQNQVHFWITNVWCQNLFRNEEDERRAVCGELDGDDLGPQVFVEITTKPSQDP